MAVRFCRHHDYGRGRPGLARPVAGLPCHLLLMEPGQVGRMIEANYGGVRVDGTQRHHHRCGRR
ncbi:MAG: hypothetical protein ACLU9S_03890 [Oscillospiraceae bacterium]